MSNTGFLNADLRPARKPTNSSGVESKEFYVVYGDALRTRFGRPVAMTLTISELRSGGLGEDGKERNLAVGSGWCTAKVADRLIGKSA